MEPLGLQRIPQEIVDEGLGPQNSQIPLLNSDTDRQDLAALVRGRRDLTSTARSGEQTSPPPYASSRLSSHVTSLKLAPTYSSNNFEEILLRADTHFSAFVNLKSLTLSRVPFVAFHDASLRACFGSLAETVRELKFSMCSLDEKIRTSLKLFTHLEALELDGNVWTPTGLLTTDIPQTLRGSFKVSNSVNTNIGLLDLFSALRIEYHTIALGYNPSSTFGRLNPLFAECKDHLKTPILTAADSTSPFGAGRSAFDLSPCEKLVEIHARLNSPDFSLITPTLRTVSSHRFRKLTVFITPPKPKIKPENWAKLEEDISALAKRVGATAGDDPLEVVICSSKTLGDTLLSEVLSLISQDACVSLRMEDLLPPSNR